MSALSEPTFKVSGIRFYTAPVGTARPVGIAALKEPAAPWKSVGDTALDQIFNMTSEGGDVTNLSTAQTTNVRQNVADRIEAFTISLQHWTLDSYKLFYGANTVVTADGAVEIPTKAVPTETAFLAVLEDGEKVAGFYAAKASVIRDGDIAVADKESLNSLPIRVTGLNAEGAKSAITAIPPMLDVRKAAGTAVVADGKLTGITITDGGAGYTEAPVVTIAAPAGSGGTAATAKAVIADGSVTAVVITSAGAGYTTAPNVTFAEPK